MANKPVNADFGHGLVRAKVNNPSGATDITVAFTGYSLVTGGMVSLLFQRDVPAGATLNINNQGAKPIYYRESALTDGVIKANDRCLFMYNSTMERYYLIAIDRWGADIDALAAVARTGSYNDLIDKPTIPAAQIQSDWNQTDNTQKDYIKNKPAIPDSTSDLTNDSGFITVNDVPAEVFVCTYDDTNNTMDKTANEIIAAKEANKFVICKFTYPTTDYLILNKATNGPLIVFTGLASVTSNTSITSARLLVLRYTTTDGWNLFVFDLQKELASGTSIKTINNQNITGPGNIDTREILHYSAFGVEIQDGTITIHIDGQHPNILTEIDAAHSAGKTVMLNLTFGYEPTAVLLMPVTNVFPVYYSFTGNILYNGRIYFISMSPLKDQNGDYVYENVGGTQALNWELKIKSINALTIYSGSSAPSADIGSNGDIYIQTAS